MKHRDLLIAIAGVEPIELLGEFERHMSLRWPGELAGSAAGGRWGAPRAYEVLYLGRPRESVVIEAYRHLVDDELDALALAAKVIERRVITCEVDIENVLDLRDPAALRAVGLTPARLQSQVGDYADCQRVGAAAQELGMAGIVAPSAGGVGETLALFAANVPVDAWPRLTATSLWTGLPPDPRKRRSR